jgi:hypothetical protein
LVHLLRDKARRFSIARSLLGAAVALSLLLTSLSPAFAAGGQTGNVQGVVVDQATKAPLAGATINIASPTGSYSGKTDGRGQFQIVGLQVDTYVLTVTAPGFQTLTVAGVTVGGDQTVNVGTLSSQKTTALKTIGNVRSRAANSVFQPNQTVDSYTVSGDRITQTVGKEASTNENDLALAVPGVTLTDSGSITIRGGLMTEVGYQFDGVDFTEPFFSGNASVGRFNGVGSLQIVEGAGDATQSQSGSGVVNLIPKRGTYPGFGFVDAEIGSPNYFHQGAFEYGIASQNGAISDYVAYNGQRSNPYAGFSGANAAAYNQYFSTSYQVSDNFVNNFIYKFGKSNSQSLQVLYANQDIVDYGNLGGTNGLSYYPYDTNTNIVEDFAGFSGPAAAAAYKNIVGYVPYYNGQQNVTAPEQSSANPTRFLKFEYDNNLDSRTFLQLRYYNWETLQISQAVTGGSVYNYSAFYPGWQEIGGPRVGTTGELTHQFGDKNTVTLQGKYETSHPIWDEYAPNNGLGLLALADVGAVGLAGSPVTPSYADFLPGGYLAKYFPNGVPRDPISGIDYNGAWFQTFGGGIRDQYRPTDKLALDLGVRWDYQRQNYGPDQYNTNPADGTNPSDVNPATLGNQYLKPHETEPRAAISYQLDRDDSVRFGYGRSAIFLNAQTGGTPAGLYNAGPFLNVPAQPGSLCGSTKNVSLQTKTNPLGLYPCANYAQELYWLYDQNFDAPDLGGGLPAVYSNYDVTFSHQFKDGIGMKLTPFVKTGTNLPSFALVPSLLSGGAAVFTVNNLGVNRTTGVEFGLTTPDVRTGFSGFFTATYQNVFASTPPLIGGEDSLPINGSGSLGLGDVYRAAFVSPFSMRVGGSYKTHDGFRITPILQYDRGYPYSVGSTVASSGQFGPNDQFANIPQVNFGVGETAVTGMQGTSGTNSSTQYFDPAFAGDAYHPNIAATRGTPQTSSSGGILWQPNLEANLTLEYTKGRNTVGVQILNLFGNWYNGIVPQINPYYQPVANGVSGALTGNNPGGAEGFFSPAYANIPKDAYAFTNGAYLLLPSTSTPNRPMSLQAYYQVRL